MVNERVSNEVCMFSVELALLVRYSVKGLVQNTVIEVVGAIAVQVDSGLCTELSWVRKISVATDGIGYSKCEVLTMLVKSSYDDQIYAM